MCASYLLQQHFSHLSDDRETKSVLCRLVLFISSVMKSPRAEQWAVMPLLNTDLGSSAEAVQRQTNAQADESMTPASLTQLHLTRAFHSCQS